MKYGRTFKLGLEEIDFILTHQKASYKNGKLKLYLVASKQWKIPVMLLLTEVSL